MNQPRKSLMESKVRLEKIKRLEAIKKKAEGMAEGGSASAEVNDYIQDAKKKLAFEVPDKESFMKAVQASEKYQSQRDKTRYSNTDLR